MILKIYIKEDIVNNYEDLNEGKSIDALIKCCPHTRFFSCELGQLIFFVKNNDNYLNIDISSEHSTENDCLKIICTLDNNSDDIDLDDIEEELCNYIDIYQKIARTRPSSISGR